MASPSISKRLTTRDVRVGQLLRDRSRRIRELKESTKYKLSPYRPAHEVIRNGVWKNQKCFIVGGGPSLEGFDFNRLKGKGKIIAVNKSYLDVPFADVLYFMDGKSTSFYGLVKSGKLGEGSFEKWKEFQGFKFFLNIQGRKLDDVYSIKSLGRNGLSQDLKKGIYHGNNSGLGALMLAICLRANPIYLLGIDGKFLKGKSHYHGGYGARKHPETVYKSFVREFEKAAKMISRTNYKVINLNSNSAVKCFKFGNPEKVLND